jgi:prepilin-type N-terminal cleavage/methylation domain-containing protein
MQFDNAHPSHGWYRVLRGYLRPAPQPCQQTGFTLIELLLALLMFTIVTTAVFATFSAIANGVEHGRKRIERIHIGLTARQRLLQEISSAYRMQHSACNRESTSDKRPSYICEPLKGEDHSGLNGMPHDRIAFLTIPLQHFPAQQARSELCQICYFIDQNSEGQPALFRYENCRLGGETEGDDRCSGAGETLELTDAIVGLNFVYYGSEEEPQDVWPEPMAESVEPQLPCRIHISLTLRDAPPDETVETTVSLPMQNVCGQLRVEEETRR